jgi:hypothetical protein
MTIASMIARWKDIVEDNRIRQTRLLNSLSATPILEIDPREFVKMEEIQQTIFAYQHYVIGITDMLGLVEEKGGTPKEAFDAFKAQVMRDVVVHLTNERMHRNYKEVLRRIVQDLETTSYCFVGK